MKRQGMEVSVKALRKLADRLEKELMEDHKNAPVIDILTQVCIVPIVNKTGASDDWKFEREKKVKK
jgi:hypothetical protein